MATRLKAYAADMTDLTGRTSPSTPAAAIARGVSPLAAIMINDKPYP